MPRKPKTVLPKSRPDTSMVITPDQARALCEQYNITLKTCSRNRVRSYQDMMERGLWHPEWCFDPIEFGKPTNDPSRPPALLNGRKRILACALSGVPLETWVLRDVPNEVLLVIDDIIAENLASMLSREDGFRYTGVVTAVAYMAVRLELNGYSLKACTNMRTRGHASRLEAYYMAMNNRDRFVDAAALASKMSKSTRDRGLFSYAKFLYLIEEFGTKTQATALNQFATTFATDPKTNACTDAAVKTIRERIDRLERYEPLDTRWVIGVLLKALDAYAAGAAPVNLGDNEDVLTLLEGSIRSRHTVTGGASD